MEYRLARLGVISLTIPAFAADMIRAFLIALGVVVGGSLVGSLSSICTDGLPLSTMAILAQRLKIWAMAAALGGTFATIENIEAGLLQGHPQLVLKQLLFVCSCFLGAHLGYLLMVNLAGGKPS